MSSELEEFNQEMLVKLLAVLAMAPDSQLDATLAKRMKEFAFKQHTPAEVWNFYKEMLDMAVHIGGANGMVLTALNLELFYKPPEGEGVLLKRDRSVESAPWRQP